MLNIIVGTAGTGKSRELASRIGAAVSEGKSVYALAPDQFNFEFGRMLYKQMGAELFNRMELSLFSRIARNILRSAGTSAGSYADDTVRTIVMFRALKELTAEKALDFYAHQAENHGFISDALEFVKTFRVNNISPELLSDKTGMTPDAIRGKYLDISLIYTRYSKLLRECGYKDGDSDIAEAAKKAEGTDFFRGMNFYIDEFKSFTPDECELLKVMISQAESVTVALNCDTDSGAAIFATPLKTLGILCGYAESLGVPARITRLTENRRFKYPELEHFSLNVLRPVRRCFEGSCGHISVYKADDPYAEADYVCAEIRRLITRENYRCNEIVILTREKQRYSSVIESAAQRYGIPLFSSENGSVSHKSLIIFVSTALVLASKGCPSAEEWLRYAKTGFAGIDNIQCSILEDYCYKWSVEGEMWLAPFRISDDNDNAAEEARRLLTEPVAELRVKSRGATAAEICRAVYAFFDRISLQKNIEAASSEGELIKAANADAMAALRELRQLWNMLCGTFTTIYHAVGNVKMSMADFADMFMQIAAGLKISAPPQTLDAVSVFSSDTARLASPRAVFVVGANEGLFPYAVKPSALITDKEISALKKCGLEIGGGVAEKINDEYYTVYAAVSAASERLYISYAAASPDGSAMYPSVPVKQAQVMFGGGINRDASSVGMPFFCSTQAAAYYQYVQNYHRGDNVCASVRAALEEAVPSSRTRFEYLDGLATVHRHRLSPQYSAVFGKKLNISASRFEDYKKCPFMYFCKVGLNIYPAKRIVIDAPSKGNIVHYCLCGFMRDVPAEAFRQMEDETMLEKIGALLREYYESDEIGGKYGKTMRYSEAYGRLASTLFDILSRLRDEFSQSEFKPAAFEYRLRSDGDEPPVKFGSGDAEVYFIGSVDRVDTYTEGGTTYVRVIDYKTGEKKMKLEDIYYGIDMQMLLYLFAITEPGLKGNFHSDIPAGVLYMPAHDMKCTLDRGEEDIEPAKKETFKMNGIMLAERGVLEAMEQKLEGFYIPIKLDAHNEFKIGTTVFGTEDFKRLRRYTEELVGMTAKDIYGGKIEANPLISRDSDPCGFCDYRSVCGNYPNIVRREYVSDAAAQMKNIILGKEADENG